MTSVLDPKGDDVEARKVSNNVFTASLVAVGLALGWVQWGINAQDKRIAVAEAKADAALKSYTELNQSLSIQLTQLQVDVQWIKIKLDELKAQPRR